MPETPANSSSVTESQSTNGKLTRKRHPLKPLSPLQIALGTILLVAVCWLAFLPLLNANLLWPEADFIERSASRSLAIDPDAPSSILAWIQTNPLVTLSFKLENRISPHSPKLHFALNIAIHLFNCLLLWWTLRALRVKVAFATALLFCVHPVVLQPLFWSGYRETLLAMTPLLISTGIAASARSTASHGLAVVVSVIAPFLHPLALCQPVLLMGMRLRRVKRDGIRAFNPVLPYLMIALALGVFISTISVEEYTTTNEETALWVEPEKAPASYLGQQMNHALKRAFLPFEFMLFHPQQSTLEGGAQPAQALHFLPFLLLLPPLLLGILRFRDPWAPSLLFGLIATSALLLFFLFHHGHGPAGELVHEDNRLYFALPAMLALCLGVFRFGFEKMGPLAGLLKVSCVSVLLIVNASLSFTAAKTLSDSVTVWESINETLPGSWAAQFGLIQARIQHDASGLDFDWMQQTILGILRERPDFTELRLRLLALYRDTGRLEQAERQVRQLLFDSPRDLDLLRLFADINAEMGRTWEVVNAHERILAQAPDNETSLRVLTQLHLDNQRYTQAAALLERLSAIAPEDLPIALTRSQVLRALNDYSTAEAFHATLPTTLQTESSIRIEAAWVRAGSNLLEARDMARRLEYELRDEPEALSAVRQLLNAIDRHQRN